MKYRKKPVVIEAVQFFNANVIEAQRFCPSLVTVGVDDAGAFYERANPLIPTLEGDMMVTPGDWIIRGVNGEFYPCKPDIFAKTYEPASEPDQQADAREELTGEPNAKP